MENSAPTTGLSVPVMARIIAIKLSVMENVILSLIVVIIRFESASSFSISFFMSNRFFNTIWGMRI